MAGETEARAAGGGGAARPAVAAGHGADRAPGANPRARVEEPRVDLDQAGTGRLLELLLGAPEPRGQALDSHDLAELSRWGPARLEEEGGLDPAGARVLAAAFALGRRVEAVRWVRADSVRSPGGVFRLMAPRLRGLEREVFSVLLVDGKHRLIDVEQVSEGTLTTSLVHPREVFRPALRRGAAALVVAHNHPSGDPEPSAEDVEVTRRLLDAGRLLGVPLLDHVVLGRGAYVSLRERMGF